MVIVNNLCLTNRHTWDYDNKRQLSDVQIYLRFFTAHITSILQHLPNTRVYTYYFYDANEPTQVSADSVVRYALKQGLPRVYLPNWDMLSLHEDLSKKTQEQYKGWLMRERYLAIKEFLETANEPVLFMDIDTIVRCSTLLDCFRRSRFDYSCLYRPNHRRYKYNAGVQFYNNTKGSKHFLNHLLAAFPKDDERLLPRRSATSSRALGVEQIVLGETIDRFRQLEIDFAFLELPNMLNDSELYKHSVVWHGNRGDKEEKLHIFETEMKRLKELRR